MKKKSKKLRRKEEFLKRYLSFNQKILEELENLFEMSPPGFLKNSLSEIFFSYLVNTDPQDYDPVINEIAENFHFLIKFLEKAEKENIKSTKKIKP
jgi:hypothetical protein